MVSRPHARKRSDHASSSTTSLRHRWYRPDGRRSDRPARRGVDVDGRVRLPARQGRQRASASPRDVAVAGHTYFRTRNRRELWTPKWTSSSNCLLKGVKIGAPIVATNLPGPILIGRQQTLCLAAVGPKPSCAGWLVSGGHNLRHRVKTGCVRRSGYRML
jgi:hypothetical protein